MWLEVIVGRFKARVELFDLFCSACSSVFELCANARCSKKVLTIQYDFLSLFPGSLEWQLIFMLVDLKVIMGLRHL